MKIDFGVWGAILLKMMKIMLRMACAEGGEEKKVVPCNGISSFSRPFR
jgi:hypothetical protein